MKPTINHKYKFPLTFQIINRDFLLRFARDFLFYARIYPFGYVNVSVAQGDVIWSGCGGGCPDWKSSATGWTHSIETNGCVSKDWKKTKTLYYVATPSSHIDEEDKKVLRGVADAYLTTQGAYSEEDRENTIKAMHCYKSQFALDLMESRADRWRNGDQKVYLRPVLKGTKITKTVFVSPI